MLHTIFIWLLLFLFSYVVGEMIIECLNLIRKCKIDHGGGLFPYLMGITFIIFYAQTISLFHALDKWAFYGLVCICFVGIVIFRKHFKNKIYQYMTAFQDAAQHKIVMFCVLVILLAVYGYIPLICVQPVSHYDTYLYQAQAVHWLEEYGCVKGIANVNSRIGFNSSILAVDALLGMKWLFGYSLHGVNSFFAVLLVTESIIGLAGYKKHTFHMTDVVRALSLIYIFSNRSQINSVGTDFPNMMLTAGVLIIWLGLLEKNVETYAEYAMLCMVMVGIVTIKFSSLFILLLAWVPLKKMWKSKNIKALLIWGISGVIMLLPFLIRNYFVSGWLLYPFAGIDLFDVPWKIPKAAVVAEAKSIFSWARIPWAGWDQTLEGPFMFWVPAWWHNQSLFTKTAVVSDVILFVYGAIFYLLNVKKKRCIYANFLLMCSASFWYWLLTAPDVRFAWIYVMILPYVFILGMIYDSAKCKEKESNRKTIHLLLATVLMFNALVILKNSQNVTFIRGSLSEIRVNYRILISQQEYAHLDLDGYMVDGVEIMYPISGDQTGYFGFPGAVSYDKAKQVGLLGTSLEDGFKTIEEQ